MLITSQHFIDDAIVSAKREAGDFEVFVSPTFDYEGESFRVVLDGNHSLAAAVAAGVEPEFTEMTASDHDAIALLDRGDVESFLAAVDMGEGDWIDALTRRPVWA